MKTVTARSFAKINLGLGVLGKRTDGYHEIRTVLQAIDLADQITFRESSSLTFEVEGEYEIPTDQSNLVLKAARALVSRFPGHGAHIKLKKSIPPGSGLGGGSSNAAVTLLGLDRLWGLEADPGLLYSLAQDLGMDVPFFLYGGTCLALGRGDEVFPLSERPPWHVVVVWPGVGLSTQQVYEELSPTLTSTRILSSMKRFVPVARQAGARDDDMLPGGDSEGRGVGVGPPEVANDLEEIAFRKIPTLSRLKKKLISSGAVAAAMSGSGSAAFGLYPSSRGIREVAAGLETEAEAVFTCRTLTRDAYCRNLFQH